MIGKRTEIVFGKIVLGRNVPVQGLSKAIKNPILKVTRWYKKLKCIPKRMGASV
jgi:hypothetical protein